jgi:hypothetical protein
MREHTIQTVYVFYKNELNCKVERINQPRVNFSQVCYDVTKL